MVNADALALGTVTIEEKPMPDDRPEHVTTTEARAGSTPHMTRYVLSIGLLLVIVLFAIILFVGG
jgi:hypothetical protein